MCGITGFFAPACNVSEWEAPSRMRFALSIIAVRTPGACGWMRESALGHRRLSILDLSERGRQPMLSPSGRYVMVYNGEVYNFRDVRRELESAGRSFTSSGDSELVLAAIETWGVEAAVRRFIGMFAIAVWDQVERRLLLVRDRLGVKPLYLRLGRRVALVWVGAEGASCVSPLAARNRSKRAQPTTSTTGYINAPRSIYRNVFKLEPGHWLELKEGGEPVVRRYWSVLDALHNPLHGTEDQLAEQLESLMSDAFRLRMVSDVPVGMFLSGGLDSSVVTALLQKQYTATSTHSQSDSLTIASTKRLTLGELPSTSAPTIPRRSLHLTTPKPFCCSGRICMTSRLPIHPASRRISSRSSQASG